MTQKLLKVLIIFMVIAFNNSCQEKGDEEQAVKIDTERAIKWKLNRTSPQQLTSAQEFDNLLEKFFSNTKGGYFYKEYTITRDAATVLQGVPNEINYTSDVVVIDGCRSQSCMEKGLFISSLYDDKTIVTFLHFLIDGKYENGEKITIFYRDEKFLNEHKNKIYKWLTSLDYYDMEQGKSVTGIKPKMEYLVKIND